MTLYRTVGEMPSLQQTSFKDWPSPDIARSLTGPDILQKHSINSLLLEHNEIISRGLPSPIEENVSFSELLGSSQSSQSTSTSSLLGNSGHHGGHHKYGSSSNSSIGGSGGICPDSSAASSILGSGGSSGPNSASSPSVLGSNTNPFCFTGLSMSSSSLNSPELGTNGGGGGGNSVGGGGQSPTYYGSGGGLHKSFDDFRFDGDLGLSSNASNNGSSNLTSETLKLLQRNMASSYQDCSPLPTSPSSSSSTTAAALCARYFRNSQQQQQLGDLNHNGYEPTTSSSSLFSNVAAAANHSSSSLSRSNSPPDHHDASLLSSFDSTNILDMISYLTINQHQQQNSQQQQQQQHYSNNSSNGSSHYGQTSSSSSSLNSFYQHQQQQHGGGGSSYGGIGQGINSNNNGLGGGGCGGFSTNDYERLQNLQALNALRLLQQSQYQLQQQYQQQFNQLMPYGGSQLKNWSPQNSPPSSTSSQGSCNGGGGSGSGGNDINLDRIARFHRSSAAHYDATCTWSGVLPPRSHRLVTYSSKIFLGGMPWDISEQSLVQIFKPFGSIKVEWPGKEQQATQPKGYVYIIFESDKQVKALLQACTYTDANGYGSSSSRGGGNNSAGMMSSSCGSDDMQLVPLSQAIVNKQQPVSMANARINFKISSKRIKSKDVEVIPWNIADSNYVKSTSQKLDPTKTVFVGALHGQLTAEGLAKIMNDLFDGVVYVGIDTDKYKYPLGSARVTFNNSRSYMKAVVAAFIEIKTAKFTKKLQVDPYLEDSLCSMCGVQHGPYFCREIVCFRYFCRSCWQFQHNRDVSLQNHKPLTRNSKSTTIVGVGPQQQQHQHQQSPSNNADSSGLLHRRQQQLLYHQHMTQQQQPPQQQSSPTSDVHRRLYNVGHLQDLSSSSTLSLPQSPSPSCTTSSSGSSTDSSPVNCHGPANLHQQLQQQFGAGGL